MIVFLTACLLTSKVKGIDSSWNQNVSTRVRFYTLDFLSKGFMNDSSVGKMAPCGPPEGHT